MTNREFYKEDILNVSCDGNTIAFDIKTNKIVPCDWNISCHDCIFEGIDCNANIKAWCNCEYTIDWSKVAVDTKVLVSVDGGKWIRRYFAKYEDGRLYTFALGCTSWNSYDGLQYWKYAKLAEE